MHYDLIDPAIVNQTSIGSASLPAGTIVGIITADGNRAFMRVDSLSSQLAVTFVVYQN